MVLRSSDARPFGHGVLLAAVIAVGCKRAPPAPPVKPVPPCGELGAPAASAATASSGGRAPTLKARIFTDISGHGKGFAAPTLARAPLRALHLALDRAVQSASGVAPKNCLLGERRQCVRYEEPQASSPSPVVADAGPPDAGVTPPLKVELGPRCVEWAPIFVSCSENAENWANPALYAAPSSTVDKVLVPEVLPELINPHEKQASDWTDEAELTVLVLSGFSTGSLSAPASSSAREACQGGPSPACVGAALRERVKSGYGVWLTFALLEFDGQIASDVTTDARYVQQFRAHVEELNLVRPGDLGTYGGVRFRAGRQLPGNPSQKVGSYFLYRGIRPIIVLALSRKADVGRAFTQALVEALRQDPTAVPGRMDPKRAIQSAELAPLAFPDAKFSGLSKAPLGRPENDGQGENERMTPAAIREMVVNEPVTHGNVISAELSCGQASMAWLNLHYAETPSPIVVPAFLKQNLQLTGPTSDGPMPQRSSLAQPLQASKDGYRIFIGCNGLPLRPRPWVVAYDLERNISLDEAAAASSFWNVDSTAIGYEAPERAFGLANVAREVFAQAVKKQTLGRVCLSVSRRQ